MKRFLVLVALVCGAVAEEVRLVDLDPNEAQQLINSQDQTLKYAPKIESNVPAVRYLGNEPHHVQEDIYLAKQYHGQDGLGGYLYGYQVPDIAKNEKKEPSGDLKGAYNYVNGDGKEVKVEYWDNGDGFHQIDNVPEIAPKQVEDAPDVAAAKEEFFRRWNEEAKRNQHPVVDPNANVNQYLGNQQGIQQSQYQQQPAGGSQYFSNPNPLQNQGSNPQYAGTASTTNQQNVPYVHGQQQHQQPGPSYVGIQSTQSTRYSSQSQQNYAPTQASIYGSSHSQNIPQIGNQYQGFSYQPGQPQSLQGQGQTQSSYGAQHPAGSQQWVGQASQSSLSHGSQPNPLQTGAPQGQYQAGGSNKYQSSQNQIDYSGQYSDNKNYYAQPQQQKSNDGENQEENGPPKGFFYSFEYPVGIIVQKGERALPAGDNRSVRDVYEKNKANFEAQLQAGKSSGTQSSYHYVKN